VAFLWTSAESGKKAIIKNIIKKQVPAESKEIPLTFIS
jgi:hypothetical protein